MDYLYLDHNVFIECLTNDTLLQILCTLRNRGIHCVYSPAHIEEIYKEVVANPSYVQKKDRLFAIINATTSNTEVLPIIDSSKALVIKHETPQECYNRVSGIDTTQRVESDSLKKFNIDTSNYKPLMKNAKYTNISNQNANDIWEWKEIKDIILQLNNNIVQIINNYNSSLDVIMLKLMGIDKTIPLTFKFEKGNYPNVLCKNHTQLEFTIEILFRVLNYFGYWSEKEKKAVSGTHDVSHAIYGSISKYLITADKRFAKKCEAVYAFLGIGTKVIFCKQENYIEMINNL